MKNDVITHEEKKKTISEETFTIIISDKEPSTLLIPLVSVSAGELEREPLHPKR